MPKIRSIVLNVVYIRVSFFGQKNSALFGSPISGYIGKNPDSTFMEKQNYTKLPQLFNVTFSLYRTHMCKIKLSVKSQTFL